MSTSNGCFPRVLEKGKGSLAALKAVRYFSISTQSLLQRGMQTAAELQQGDKHPWKRSLWVAVLALQESIPTLVGEGVSGGALDKEACRLSVTAIKARARIEGN